MEQCKGILDQLGFDEEILRLMTRALKESFSVEIKDHADAFARLRIEQDRLHKRLEALYVDKADGKVDQQFYDTMRDRWRRELDRCARDAQAVETASWEYRDEGIALLTLAQKAGSIFETEPSARKRMLLNLACSNLTWANGELRADFKQSFDLLAKTLGSASGITRTNRHSGFKLLVRCDS